MEERWYEIKVSELRKVTYKTEYEDKLKQRWERVLGDVLEGVEKEWRRFKETILEVGEEGFGTKRIKQGMRRKGSAWRSEEIKRIVRKKECFSIWRRSRREEDLEEYRKMKRVVEKIC